MFELIVNISNSFREMQRVNGTIKNPEKTFRDSKTNEYSKFIQSNQNNKVYF